MAIRFAPALLRQWQQTARMTIACPCCNCHHMPWEQWCTKCIEQPLPYRKGWFTANIEEKY